jgi:hypothetical protein
MRLPGDKRTSSDRCDHSSDVITMQKSEPGRSQTRFFGLSMISRAAA